MTRTELLLKVLDVISPGAGYVARKAWLLVSLRFQVSPWHQAGRLAGCVLIDGPEIHFCAFGPVRGTMRPGIRRYLVDLVSRHGYAKTTVSVDNSRGFTFCSRLGFRVEGQDQHIIHMKCTEVRYA